MIIGANKFTVFHEQWLASTCKREVQDTTYRAVHPTPILCAHSRTQGGFGASTRSCIALWVAIPLEEPAYAEAAAAFQSKF